METGRLSTAERIVRGDSFALSFRLGKYLFEGLGRCGPRRKAIKVPHEADKRACARDVRVFLETGSHFLTNAEWGCFDGEHKAWIILKMDSKEAARSIVPPAFQADAKIVELNRFTLAQLDEMERKHRG
jgi:hypothetical protein